MKNVRFRRIYARFEEGIEPNAIVAYAKTPYYRRPLESGPDAIVGTLYRHVIVVDCWLFQFRIGWIDRRFT